MANGEFDLAGWSGYFDTIIQLLEEADRQYGVANQQYTQYVLERFDFCVHTCTVLRSQMPSGGGLQAYQQALDELLACFNVIRQKWQEYQDILDSGSSHCQLAYQVNTVHTGRRGRPRFDITKDQIEYLASLSFTWSEIAALIGVSRTTIFRCQYNVTLSTYL